jgi:hypothetical protein
MKIALLISGEFRNFDISCKYWPHLSVPNIDKYFSVWKQVYQGIESHEIVNYDLIQKFNPVSIIVEDKTQCSWIQANIENLNAISQFHRIKMGLNAIIASKFAYDLVIISRSDLFFGCSTQELLDEFKKCLDNNEVGLLGDHGPFVEDIFMVLPFNVAKEFAEIDFFELITKEYCCQAPQHPLLGNIFKKYNRRSLSSHVVENIEVIRNNCREHPELNIQVVKQKFFEWGNFLRLGVKL